MLLLFSQLELPLSPPEVSAFVLELLFSQLDPSALALALLLLLSLVPQPLIPAPEVSPFAFELSGAPQPCLSVLLELPSLLFELSLFQSPKPPNIPLPSPPPAPCLSFSFSSSLFPPLSFPFCFSFSLFWVFSFPLSFAFPPSSLFPPLAPPSSLSFFPPSSFLSFLSFSIPCNFLARRFKVFSHFLESHNGPRPQAAQSGVHLSQAYSPRPL